MAEFNANVDFGPGLQLAGLELAGALRLKMLEAKGYRASVCKAHPTRVPTDMLKTPTFPSVKKKKYPKQNGDSMKKTSPCHVAEVMLSRAAHGMLRPSLPESTKKPQRRVLEPSKPHQIHGNELLMAPNNELFCRRSVSKLKPR